MKVIIDTNLWVSFTIGKRLSTLVDIINSSATIIVCREIIVEYLDVCHRPKLKKYVSNKDIKETLQLIDAYCEMVSINCEASSDIRDIDDLFLLSLADSCAADYIVTGDNDLLVLKHHHQTQIIDIHTLQELLD